MKKIIIALGIVCCVGTAETVSAQDTTTRTTVTTHRTTTTTHTRTRYFYYPDQNVYYNIESGDYYYYDAPTTKWTQVRALPATISVEKVPRYTLYYEGEDIYKENPQHIKKFKVKKDGEVKVKN
jgi:hypothetical protein